MRKAFTQHPGILLSLVFIIFSVVLNGQPKNVIYKSNAGNHGITAIEQGFDNVKISTAISSFNFIPTDVKGKSMSTITTHGVLLQNEEGAPNLPSFSKYIAIPKGANVKYIVNSIESEKFQNIDISPSPVIPKDDNNNPLVYNANEQIYSSNSLYPSQVVEVSEPMSIRGMDVVIIGIHPFQYNPVTKEMIVHKNIEIDVQFEGGNGQFGDERLRSRWWDPIIKDAVINPDVIEPPKSYNRSTNQTGCEYLIIIPDDPVFHSWADSLKNFRNQQGILTDIITTTEIGGNTISSIENYIDVAYSSWDIPPSAVLLMADYGTSGNTITSPIYDNYCVSDNIFADIDNDHMPDIVFARMTAQNEAHLETFVTKVLDYERTPPTNPDFYNKPITALGWQTERWFQICSESVGGYFKHVHGKDPVRINAIYGGNPAVDPWSTATNTNTVLNYFGPNGLGYIPSTPGELGGWSGGTADDVNNALNSGAFILQHRDHGGTNGWGEPSYNNNSINGLTNTDLSFIFSINCLTGKYNIGGECFAEKFHRYTYNGENSGALGLIAASEVSYSFVNDTYVWGMYDNMWPDFMPDYGTTPESRGQLPAFGNAAGKYFLQQSSWPYNTGNKEVTYNLFHHHGDAFSVLYSEVPQNLTVVHDQGIVAGELFFTVTADDGSFIALSVNNQIIGTADGTGEPVVIEIPAQFPPDNILVTVTKQNYYRYSSLVNVVPPEGPYVVYNDIEINNSSGQMATGENVLSSMTVKNIGVEEGNNVSVSISTDDEYIELTDDTEIYGFIDAGQTLMIEDGFGWNVADNIPDMHTVEFDVVATDGTDNWLSKMFITGHAPSLGVGNIVFDDSQNGNGNSRLDAGETVDVYITTINNGSYKALNTIGMLSCTSPFIDIISSEYLIEEIGSESSETSIFTIEVAEVTPIGSLVHFDYEAISGEYSTDGEFDVKAGLVVEDWETGDMTKFSWATGGSSTWNITQSGQYEGNYCNQSGDLDHQQFTWMSLIYESAVEDSISFYYKVSSEDGYDFFRFFIDGTQKIAASGEKDWQRAVFPVSAGTHLFKWQYSKDITEDGGQDCAWVDFIVLPTPPITSAYAGEDTEFCELDIKQCYGVSTNCSSVKWTTSGTGSFNNSAINSPVYYSSPEDIENGSVVLTFTGNGPSDTISDDVVFSFSRQPAVNAGPDLTVCSTDILELDDVTAENYTEIIWTTDGDGTFDNNTIVSTYYIPGVNDIVNGSVTLTIQANGDGACGNVTDDILVDILVGTSAYAGEDADICPGLTYHITDAAFENYKEIIWTSNGDGSFDDTGATNPIYTPGASDKEIKEVILSATATTDNGCPTKVDDILLTLYCTDIFENSQNSEIRIFPNPNEGKFSLSIRNQAGTVANMAIFNSHGKKVHTESLANPDVVTNHTIDMRAPSGLYTIQLEINGTTLSKKFIIR